MRWPDGAMYKGEWKNDMFGGKGKYLHSDTTQFEYQMTVNGEYFKVGQIPKEFNSSSDMPDGSTYTGDFLLGKKHGVGTHVWRDGSKYQGEWVENKRQGIGIYNWLEDGKEHQYHGQWLQD